jgi:histidinol phosphatase-like PHP family hydrolase
VQRALKLRAKLILNTDSHAPEDIIPCDELKKIGLKAGLSNKEIDKIFLDTKQFILKRRAG